LQQYEVKGYSQRRSPLEANRFPKFNKAPFCSTPRISNFSRTFQEGKKMRPHKRLINRITITVLAVLLLITFIVASRLTGRNGVAGNNSVVAAQSTVVAVNAVTYTAPLGLGAFSAAFGNNLAVRVEGGPVNPPLTQIAGTTLRLISGGVDVLAPLQFVSPQQINFFVPTNLPVGTAQMIVTNANGVTSTGTVQIVKANPAMYRDPSGVPVGFTVDYLSYGSLLNPDGTLKPVMQGTPWRRLLLGFMGTGFRNASSVVVRFGSIDVPAVYFGPTGLPYYDQVNVFIPPNLPPGLTTITVIADGQFASNTTQILIAGQSTGSPNLLSLSDVQTIIAQCVQSARQQNVAGTCAIVNREGVPLAVFQMNGANPMTTITAMKPPGGLEGVSVPAILAAVSKAGTAAFFSTQGSAINTRTASMIIQEHFPPGVVNFEGGPLFGVQFSQLPCSDFRPAGGTLPLGLSGDPGSNGLYRNGIALGGVAFESDGRYSIDTNVTDRDQPVEEQVAVNASFGFDTPQFLRIDNVRVNGILLPYTNVTQTGGPAPPVTAADGMFLIGPIASPPSRYIPIVLGGVQAKFDSRFFPPIASTVPGPNQLTASDVLQILTNAALAASRMRAAIRVGVDAVEINITVVDTNGVILGKAATSDAPEFGDDVSTQKARSANLFSSPNVVQLLNAADGGTNTITPSVNAALALGVPLNGSIMFSSRGMGFLARPFLPDGIDSAPNGPFSVPINVFSPFNNGIQLSLVTQDLLDALGGNPSIPCTAVPGNILANGLQIFAGSSVLFKNGQRVGAIGISGDGIDQDDLVSRGGSSGFEAPSNITSDNVVITLPGGGRVRLPYLRFPPQPNLP
jgi:uncharacterized protein (TIGR03437 family)